MEKVFQEELDKKRDEVIKVRLEIERATSDVKAERDDLFKDIMELTKVYIDWNNKRQEFNGKTAPYNWMLTEMQHIVGMTGRLAADSLKAFYQLEATLLN